MTLSGNGARLPIEHQPARRKIIALCEVQRPRGQIGAKEVGTLPSGRSTETCKEAEQPSVASRRCADATTSISPAFDAGRRTCTMEEARGPQWCGHLPGAPTATTPRITEVLQSLANLQTLERRDGSFVAAGSKQWPCASICTLRKWRAGHRRPVVSPSAIVVALGRRLERPLLRRLTRWLATIGGNVWRKAWTTTSWGKG